ncbi:MAG: O-antigen ligase family protein [Sulfuricella sp.]|nr:O-antigen ligase family protein [Sulfuricella sp.]
MVISEKTEENRRWHFSWHLLPPLLFLAILPINHTMALRMVTLFLATAIAFAHIRRHPTPAIPLKLPLALWAGMALLSLTWSADPWFSLNEIKTEIGYGLLAFLTFYILTDSKKIFRLWLAAIMLGLLATILFALKDFWQLGSWQGYEWDWQHGYVSYSTYLVTVAPFLFYLLLNPSQNRFIRYLAWLTPPLFLFIAFVNANRMFWLSFAVVTAIFLGLAWLRARHSPLGKRIALIGLASLIVAAIAFASVAKQKITAPKSTQAAVSETFQRSDRYPIWQFWSKRIAEHPWTGIGFGRDLPHYAYPKPKEMEVLWFAHAHNLFLNYLLQLGVFGLAALLFLLGSITRSFWRYYRSSNNELSLMGICGIAIVAAVVMKNMTDDLFWRTDALLFWALIGLLQGYGARLNTPAGKA